MSFVFARFDEKEIFFYVRIVESFTGEDIVEDIFDCWCGFLVDYITFRIEPWHERSQNTESEIRQQSFRRVDS